MKAAPQMLDPLEEQLEKLYEEAIDAASCPAEAFDVVNAQQKAVEYDNIYIYIFICILLYNIYIYN